MSSTICYRKLRKYKYQLLKEDFQLELDVKIPVEIQIENFVGLSAEGTLTIKAGYAWDGPSGPTVDTKTFMRGSLVHDALYQLIRAEKFEPGSRDKMRAMADDLLRDICIEDGMSSFRAWYVHRAVRWFGGAAAKENEKYFEEHSAPGPKKS